MWSLCDSCIWEGSFASRDGQDLAWCGDRGQRKFPRYRDPRAIPKLRSQTQLTRPGEGPKGQDKKVQGTIQVTGLGIEGLLHPVRRTGFLKHMAKAALAKGTSSITWAKGTFHPHPIKVRCLHSPSLTTRVGPSFPIASMLITHTALRTLLAYLLIICPLHSY